ncbi:MAG: hypothetical protein ACFFCW_12145 [Candidatus Hodarchaeota archaeon]
MLVKSIFVGGMFGVVPRLMALAIRAAADWQRWAAGYAHGTCFTP